MITDNTANKIRTLVGVDEVAKALGLHRGTVYRLVREGKLPAVKIAGSLRFDVAEINGICQDERKNI